MTPVLFCFVLNKNLKFDDKNKFSLAYIKYTPHRKRGGISLEAPRVV